jgi:hypothetical protein
MISPDKIPLKPFNETDYMKFQSETEAIVDAQILSPWDTHEKSRSIVIPRVDDLRYFNRFRQTYEGAGWKCGNLCLDLHSGVYFFVLSK